MRHDVIVQVQASWLFVLTLVWYLHYIRFLPAQKRSPLQPYLDVIDDHTRSLAQETGVPVEVFKRYYVGVDTGSRPDDVHAVLLDTWTDRISTMTPLGWSGFGQTHWYPPVHLWARDLRHGKDGFAILEAIEGWVETH